MLRLLHFMNDAFNFPFKYLMSTSHPLIECPLESKQRMWNEKKKVGSAKDYFHLSNYVGKNVEWIALRLHLPGARSWTVWNVFYVFV